MESIEVGLRPWRPEDAIDERALGKIAVRLPGHASAATTCAAIVPADEPVGELSYWSCPPHAAEV